MQFAEILLFYCRIEEGVLRGPFFVAHDRVADLRRSVMIVIMPFRMGVGQMLVGPAHAEDQLQNVYGFEAVFLHGVAHFHAAGKEGDPRDFRGCFGGVNRWAIYFIAY